MLFRKVPSSRKILIKALLFQLGKFMHWFYIWVADGFDINSNLIFLMCCRQDKYVSHILGISGLLPDIACFLINLIWYGISWEGNLHEE